MMAFSMMMFPMMVALDVFLVLEFVRQEIFYRLIRLAAAATVKGDSGLFQPFLAPPPMPPQITASAPSCRSTPTSAPWPCP